MYNVRSMNFRILYDRLKKRFAGEQVAQANDSDVLVFAPPPQLNINEGSKYGFCIHAALMAYKFGLHLPTYRHQDLLAQAGLSLSRSTINDLLNQSGELLLPLFNQL